MVASKSVVIATTPQITKQVVSALARHEIHIQEASQARDLGLDVSSARKPTRRTMAKRWVKAGRRMRRCARFGLIFWEHNHRLRPYIGKVWAKIATAMMARSPAIRWRYVRGHMSAVIATLMQHNWVPIRHTSWKDPEGNRWTLKAGGVGIDDWDFGKPSVLRLRGSCGRRLRGMSWEQAWMAGQISPRCSSMINSWKKRACMQPEACS